MGMFFIWFVLLDLLCRTVRRAGFGLDGMSWHANTNMKIETADQEDTRPELPLDTGIIVDMR